VNRGEIWWTDFGSPRGSVPAYDRPNLIVLSNAFNRSDIQTVLIAPRTSNLRLGQARGNVVLSARSTRLPKDSVANVSLLTSIDKRFLRENCGKLDGHLFEKVEGGIRLVLGSA